MIKQIQIQIQIQILLQMELQIKIHKEYIHIVIIEQRHIDLNNNNWPFEPWTARRRSQSEYRTV